MDIFLFLLGPASTFTYLFFKDSISSRLDWPQTLCVAEGDLGTCFSVSPSSSKVTGMFCLPCFLCVLGVEVQAHTFPGDSPGRPLSEDGEEMLTETGAHPRESPTLFPCGAPMFSRRTLSIQGSAVHREGLTHVCFAACSDDSAQLMVWASET